MVGRTPLLLLVAVGLCFLSCEALGATGSSWVDAEGGCKVWAPSGLSRDDFIARYAGGCREGRAQGQGKLEWLYRYASLKTKSVWEGHFDNGVFLGDLPATTHVDPLPGDEYLVRSGAIEGGTLTVIASSAQDGPLRLCPAHRVAVALAAGTPAADDGVVRRVLEAAAARYRAQCAASLGSPLMEAFDVPLEPNAQGRLPSAVARARIDWPALTISAYSNSAADEARAAQRAQAAAERVQAARRQFDAFTQRNGISAWVTSEQLDANPFRYEGKMVGLVVVLGRMLTRNTALVQSFEGGGAAVQLQGVTPDFPDRTHTVVLAAKVGQRAPAADGSGAVYTSIAAQETSTCALPGCSDWLAWSHGAQQIVWGEPVAPGH